MDREGRKSRIGLISRTCDVLVCTRWVHLDFASTSAFSPRHEARTRRDRITRSLGHSDTEDPRVQLCAYACRMTHISTRAPASFARATGIEGLKVLTQTRNNGGACARADLSFSRSRYSEMRPVAPQGPRPLGFLPPFVTELEWKKEVFLARFPPFRNNTLRARRENVIIPA